MNQRRLLRELAERYPLLVRTQYHVQIETANGMHNIWFTRHGAIKFQPCGQREVREHISPDELFGRLSKYDYRRTDRARMEQLQRFLKRVDGKQGIYVDAGWKDGRARIAVVKLFGQDMDVAVRMIDAPSNLTAELAAVELAAQLHPGDEPIYTDCQWASENYHRARWISRDGNKEADSLGNMRGAQRETKGTVETLQ